MENIQHSEQGNSGSFFMLEHGRKVAELNYRKSAKHEIIIDHTHVSDHLKGKGAGKLLVKDMVTWARQNNIKVVAQCSFAKATIDKDATLQDVLY